MNYDEDKPKRIKIKLAEDEPPAPEGNWMMVDYYLVALFVGILTLIMVMATAPGSNTDQPLDGQEYSEPEYGPGKTWKEPGSARDSFNENFSR